MLMSCSNLTAMDKRKYNGISKCAAIYESDL